MGIALETLNMALQAFRESYTGNIPLEIATVRSWAEQLGVPESELPPDPIGVKGGYYPKSGRIVLVASNIDDYTDAMETIRHEILGHYGLNILKPEDKNELLRLVTHTRNEKSLEEIWRKAEAQYPAGPLLLQAEEVFCAVAEKNQLFKEKFWAFVRARVQKILRALGLSSKEFSADELRYEANKIAEGVREGREQLTFADSDSPQFRKKKVTSDPNQFSLFDVVANSVEGRLEKAETPKTAFFSSPKERDGDGTTTTKVDLRFRFPQKDLNTPQEAEHDRRVLLKE